MTTNLTTVASSLYGINSAIDKTVGPEDAHADELALFGVLFTESEDLKNNSTQLNTAFVQLEESAKDGNQNSIDLLTNLALRNDSLGERAEKSLFAMFSALKGRYLAEDISNTTRILHESYKSPKAKGKAFLAEENTGVSKLAKPSLLLYMAGATAKPEVQKELTTGFFSKSNLPETDVWGTNRFVTENELACVVKAKNSLSTVERFNDPLSVDTLSDTLALKIQSQSETGFNWPQYFPVNTGDHWILLGIHQPEGGDKPKAFVFSSKKLSQNADTEAEMKKIIEDATSVAVDGNVSYYDDQDLQKNVPNGCGLFVASAIDLLATSSSGDPEGVIKKLQQEASRMDGSACDDFNRSSRRHLYGLFLESQKS